MPIPKDLLDLMACAFCKSPLRLEGEKLHCTRRECGLVYPVRDDIPVMLIDEADRTCPGCSASRDWKDDLLSCPKCGASVRYERK